MNNNFREGLNALREISEPEKIKMTLEKITGKKLADYEGIDALIGALMRYYNEELKNKQNKQDNTLETTNKGIVPTITEVNKKIKEIPVTDYLKKGNISKHFDSAEKIEQLIKGNSGIDNVQYIQDAIVKEVNKGYIDKITKRLYRCIKQASTNIITPNAEYFEPADNINNVKRLGGSSGSTANAEWVRLPNGLLIQWSKKTVWGDFDFPQHFKDMNYTLIGSYADNNSYWAPTGSTVTVKKVSTSTGNIWSSERVNNSWLAIGY